MALEFGDELTYCLTEPGSYEDYPFRLELAIIKAKRILSKYSPHHANLDLVGLLEMRYSIVVERCCGHKNFLLRFLLGC